MASGKKGCGCGGSSSRSENSSLSEDMKRRIRSKINTLRTQRGGSSGNTPFASYDERSQATTFGQIRVRVPGESDSIRPL